jgi:hypothetical protein
VARHARWGSRETAIEGVAHADRMTRLWARRTGETCVLRFDLTRQSITRVVGDGRETQDEMTLQVPLELACVVVPGRAAPSEAAGRRATSGVVDVACSPGGCSVSYAVRLGAMDDDDGVWLVFCGLTGEVTSVDDGEDVDNLFAALTTGRPDAR